MRVPLVLVVKALPRISGIECLASETIRLAPLLLASGDSSIASGLTGLLLQAVKNRYGRTKNVKSRACLELIMKDFW